MGSSGMSVITVLEPEGQPDEDERHFQIRNGTTLTDRKVLLKTAEVQKAGSPKKSIPVYAQVDKNRKATSKNQDFNIEKLNIARSELKSRVPSRPPTLLGAARRQRTIITDIPEESSTSEEITKNTTVTTSVKREVTETRILSPSPNTGVVSSDVIDGTSELSGGENDFHLSQSESSAIHPTDQQMVPVQSPKSILIRDVADVYLTTTVETESHEIKTRVSRDVLEEHTRVDSKNSTSRDISTTKLSPEPKTPSPTNNWNVVIRQRKPPPSFQSATTVSDADLASESNGEETMEEIQTEKVKPIFDVKIRSIPPDDLKPKEQQPMVSIPLLEMPQTVNRLKEVLTPKTAETSPNVEKLPGSDSEPKADASPEIKDNQNFPQRTVRWQEAPKTAAKDKESTVSSSDSFQSAESLRERSSSEVLEVAPTLPSHLRSSDHPMLERSTSEIVTSPDEHVRWVGGVVPVLESLSPEFLANIPVIQGGFFNQQRSPSPKDTQSHSSA